MPTVLALHDAGYQLVTIPAGQKGPKTKAWHKLRPTRDEIARHTGNFGIVLGSVIDLECDGEQAAADLAELFGGDPPFTPAWNSKRGKHYLFEADERLTALGKAVVKWRGVEIRLGAGKAAQSLIPPSTVEGFSRTWINEPGKPAKLPDAVVEKILAAQEKPKPAPIVAVSGPSDSVGDDFNRRAPWPEILEPHGWAYLGESKGVQNWQRPGKSDGLSATVGHCKSLRNDDKLYVFSSNAQPFEADKSYSKFAAWAFLNHGGDFSAAAADLATKGYGAPSLWQDKGRNDAANARRFALQFGDSIRWDDRRGIWYIWNGRYWEPDETCRIESLAKQCAKTLWGEAGKIVANEAANQDVKRAAITHAKTSNNASGIANMIKLARSEPEIAITSDQLDLDRYLLNCENGTIDLQTGKLRQHAREDFITRIVPTVYDPTATAPLFIAFLERIFGGNQNLIQFIARLLGYCLTGDVSEQILAIFHGSGANGKSTLINALLHLLGRYAGKAAPQLLTAKRLDAHPVELAALFGLRLAIASETENSAQFAESRVKELTGGDRIKARGMYENFFDFDPTHKLVVATNHKPAVAGSDYAIWRRLKLIPFAVTIPESERDIHFGEKLKGELPGILHWLVSGCLEWQRTGLQPPAEVIAATQEYRDAEDSIAAFIAECCEAKPDSTVGSATLLEAYKEHSGDQSMNPKRFAGLLGERGFISDRIKAGPGRGRKQWHGLALTGSEV